MGLIAASFSLLALQSPKPPAYDPLHPPPYDAAWTKEAWTADEAPYLAVRREVEAYTLGRRVSRTKTDLVERTRSTMTDAAANPKDRSSSTAPPTTSTCSWAWTTAPTPKRS